MPGRAPAVATWGLGVGAMWLWHAPTLCDAAARVDAMQRAPERSRSSHGRGVLVAHPRARAERRLSPLAAIVYLFTACVACTVLGILDHVLAGRGLLGVRAPASTRSACCRSSATAGASRPTATRRSAACSCGSRRASSMRSASSPSSVATTPNRAPDAPEVVSRSSEEERCSRRAPPRIGTSARPRTSPAADDRRRPSLALRRRPLACRVGPRSRRGSCSSIVMGLLAAAAVVSLAGWIGEMRHEAKDPD